MRVGIVAENYNPLDGGAFNFVHAIVEAIGSCTTTHTFVIHSSPAPRWRGNVKRASHAVGAGRLLSQAVRQARALKRTLKGETDRPVEKFVRENQIDVVWFLNPITQPISAPFITTVWDLAHRIHPFFPEVSTTGWTWEEREEAYRSTLPRAARIFTGTQAGKNEIVGFYGVRPENVVVIPMPIADDETPADGNPAIDVKSKYRIERPFLLYPAQFWPHKNHANLLLALDILKRGGTELDLVLTGQDKGNLAYVSDMAERLGLSPQVHLLGFVPKADLGELYRQALCLAFPSFFGPDNIPPLEAFALGCPVAAARVSGAEEQLGDAALLFDPVDPADMARAIAALHDDGALRAQLVERGKGLVSGRTARSYVAQVCQALDEFAPFRRSWGHGYIHT